MQAGTGRPGSVSATCTFTVALSVAAIVVLGLLFAANPYAGVAVTTLWIGIGSLLYGVLQVLVAVHVLGVIVESWKAKDALVPAMFTGRKRRRADEPAAMVTAVDSLLADRTRHAALVELKLSALNGGSLHAGDASGPLLTPAALPYEIPAEAA